jgi:hypothetical protein
MKTRTNVIIISGWKHRGKIGWIHGDLQRISRDSRCKVTVHIKGEPHSIPAAITQVREVTDAENILLSPGSSRTAGFSGLPNRQTKA